VQTVGEYIDTRVENRLRGEIGSKRLALGTILFF
jgi:hypothetical protein